MWWSYWQINKVRRVIDHLYSKFVAMQGVRRVRPNRWNYWHGRPHFWYFLLIWSEQKLRRIFTPLPSYCLFSRNHSWKSIRTPFRFVFTLYSHAKYALLGTRQIMPLLQKSKSRTYSNFFQCVNCFSLLKFCMRLVLTRLDPASCRL